MVDTPYMQPSKRLNRILFQGVLTMAHIKLVLVWSRVGRRASILATRLASLEVIMSTVGFRFPVCFVACASSFDNNGC